MVGKTRKSERRKGVRTSITSSRVSGLAIAVTLVGVLCSSSACAQSGSPGGGWGSGGQYNRLYNPQTVETITGVIEKVDRTTPLRGMGQGIHLLVKTDQGTTSVHLGPAWFIENQDIQLKPKDQVQVTGSRVTFQGQPAIIASEVREGDEVLRLRDASGVPVWAGWRRGSAGASGGAPGGTMMGRGMMGGSMGMGMMGTNTGSGMMGGNMAQHHQEMMAEHQKMMSEMKAMDTDLDRKLAQMNEAQGNARIDAMAAVINDLVKERQRMRQRMNAMQERMTGEGTNTK
jgi:hypothetical protein